MKSDNDKATGNSYFIYTDSYRTKDLIWDAYSGFISNYAIFSMYKRDFGRTHRVARAGAVRYASEFYHEIRSFLSSFETTLKKENIDKLHNFFNSFEIKLKDEDLFFLRTFYDDFMFKAGFKSILMTKDERDAATRFMNSRYSDIDWKGVPDDVKDKT